MSMNLFDVFGPLDDLIQVIYQASHRFVLLSRVEFDAPVPGWQLYVGLADKGRWWKGRWEEKDVDAFVGKNVSSELLEAFADNIARTITQGEIFVKGIGIEPGSDMKVVFGVNEAKPLAIPLTELSQQEAIVFITNEFFELGLNAQKRKWRFNPPAFQPVTIAPVALPKHHPRRSPSPVSPPTTKTRNASPSPPPSQAPKAPVAKIERRRHLPETAIVEKAPDTSTSAKPKHKAVPAKRARKIQKMEFASDDE